MVKDSIADLLVRIKNAQAIKKESTEAPYSALLWEIARVLEARGFIAKADRRGKRIRRSIELELAYDEHGQGRVAGARRISKQSRRVYKKASDLHPVRHGHGAEVVSTSRGIMTGDDARRAKIGGEVLFEIW